VHGVMRPPVDNGHHPFFTKPFRSLEWTGRGRRSDEGAPRRRSQSPRGSRPVVDRALRNRLPGSEITGARTAPSVTPPGGWIANGLAIAGGNSGFHAASMLIKSRSGTYQSRTATVSITRSAVCAGRAAENTGVHRGTDSTSVTDSRAALAVTPATNCEFDAGAKWSAGGVVGAEQPRAALGIRDAGTALAHAGRWWGRCGTSTRREDARLDEVLIGFLDQQTRPDAGWQ
jgi:hypothetical protein